TKPTTIPAWYHSLMVLNLGRLSTKKWGHRPHLGVSSNDAGSGDWENIADLRGSMVYQNKYNRSEPQQPEAGPLVTRIVGAAGGLEVAPKRGHEIASRVLVDPFVLVA